MKRKNNLIFPTMAILILITFGATYAFFQAQKGQGASAYININSDTTDMLTFSVGDSININASTEDFYEGGENKSGTTSATAKLVPNNTTNEAHEKYNVYFIIDANDFIYTTDDKQVEVLLKVEDPDGNSLKSIEGINYHDELEGFDITKSQGAFKITLDNPIDANSEDGTTETWNFEVILRNLSTNQALNAGKSFSGKVLITTDVEETYIVPEINTITEASKTYESITVSLIENELHSSEIDKYYYAIEETDEDPESAIIMSIAERLEPNYIESAEPTHTFTEIDGQPLKDNQSYKIYAYAEDVQGIRSSIKTAIIKTDKYTRVQVTGFDVIDRTLTSIKVKATAIAGTKQVKEYAFMIEGNEKYGNWSNWQASDEFEFTELADTTAYNIQVKVRDELDKESVGSFDKTESTEAYVYPSVKTFTVSDITSSVIKVNGTFENGTGTVSKVEYQRNGDANWYQGANTSGTYSYSFTSLTKATAYTFKIKVTDSNNREKILEDVSYTGTTLNNYLVQVQVTGGTSTPNQATVDHGKSTNFTIAASAGYDITTARVTGGTDCSLNNAKTTLTASNVTAARTCTVTIYKTQTLSSYVISKVGTSGSGTLAQHTTSLANSAKDNSYRYSGNNPNNYVCFGSGSETYNNGGTSCPDTNLYRIIGVFNNQVKLIKSEYIKSAELGIASDGKPSTSSYDSLKRVKVAPSEGFKWNQTADNTWSTSTLYQALNNGYLTFLGTTWTNKIATTWHVGGHSGYMVTPKEMYDAEIASTPTVPAQIGLMYISDYGFASEQKIWTSQIHVNNNTIRENNWLFNNVYEWTISRISGSSNSAFNVYSFGYVRNYLVSSALGVRPAFYLNSNVQIKVDDAIGDVDHPFRIVV